MPVTGAHLNGSVNLPDAETVMREVSQRIGAGLRRVSDGEPGERQNWIFFQFQKFLQTPGLEQAEAVDQPAEGYEQMPRVRLVAGADPATLVWPDLGYAGAYGDSFAEFERLQAEGVIGAGVRFQVQYPTPLASINSWVVPEDQDRLLDSYQTALFADLDRLLVAVPHERLAVQWDVAVELAILEGGFVAGPQASFDTIVDALVTCVNQVADDVPVGLHLCYGDYGHRHFKEPESLELQVLLANEIVARARRPVAWFSITVPQEQREDEFFRPLADLVVGDAELYFGIVPYHPADQPAGTTAEQVRLIDEHLGHGERVDWGVCTECGMGRAQREEVPRLLDLHREIIDRSGS